MLIVNTKYAGLFHYYLMNKYHVSVYCVLNVYRANAVDAARINATHTIRINVLVGNTY